MQIKQLNSFEKQIASITAVGGGHVWNI